MSDFQGVASSSAPSLENHDSIAYGYDRRTARGRIVDTVMRPSDSQYRMHARSRKTGTDPGEFQRSFEQVFTQAVPLFIPVLQFAVLYERNGVVGLTSVLETGPPDRADVDTNRIDIELIVDDGELIVFLQTEKVNAPGINVG